jgi:Na+/H+ antiporter NhaD/arsenite permease-like protein
VMPISSVPAILITSSQGIGFIEYISFSGVISTLLAFSTAIIFAILNRNKFKEPDPKQIEIFMSESAWVFVKDKGMMLNITTIFLGVILMFIIVPSSVLTPDIIAIMGAGIALFVNRKHGIRVMKEMDFDLVIYLLSVFVVSGCLEAVGVIELIKENLASLNVHDPSLAFLLLLWIGALASAFVDNIPITKLLLSIINVLMGERGTPNARLGAMGLSLGIIWGDNLTPFGDSILAIGVAQNHNVKIAPKEFGKISATTTLIQLTVISLIILGMFMLEVLIIEIIVGTILIFVFLLIPFLKKRKNKKTNDQKGNENLEKN